MRVYWVIGALLATSFGMSGAAGETDRAEKLYYRTDYEGSLKVLLAAPQKDSRVSFWIGRNYYMLAEYKKATEYMTRAAGADPDNSEYFLWLGRAWGRRAETSNPLSAPGHASRARQAFERAVALNPKSLEAMNDLFEYYLQAPGFLGGGADKAAGVARRIAARDPVEGHYASARLAEKSKEFGNAEQQLRRAAELAPQQIGRVIDLAKFLAKQGRVQESEQTFQQAARINPDSPKLMFARAETYIRDRRNFETARNLLKKYLQSDLTPDDPPRSEAEKLLREASGV